MSTLNDYLTQKREALRQRHSVDRTCPILNLLRHPQHVTAEIRHAGADTTIREHAA